MEEEGVAQQQWWAFTKLQVDFKKGNAEGVSDFGVEKD